MSGRGFLPRRVARVLRDRLRSMAATPTSAGATYDLFRRRSSLTASSRKGPVSVSPGACHSSAALGLSATLISCQGNLSPGSGGPGILTCNNLVLSGHPPMYFIDLNGAVPGSGYDQLLVLGTNNLASATLHPNPTFSHPVAVGNQLTFYQQLQRGSGIWHLHWVASRSQPVSQRNWLRAQL